MDSNADFKKKYMHLFTYSIPSLIRLLEYMRPTANKAIDALGGALASAKAMLAKAWETTKAVVFSRAFVTTIVITAICVFFGHRLSVQIGDGMCGSTFACIYTRI